jgi:cation transport ATPase
MEIDLSSLDIFESNKINFDKKITFIFGKNGTGKSTITKEIKKLTTSYEISIFQGFSDLIDENKRLNAVILGEENKVINNKIENKKSELIKVLSELETIEKSLNKPEDEHITNFWTKKYKAEQDYLLKEKNR